VDEKHKKVFIRVLLVFWFGLFIFLFFKKLPDNNLHLIFCDVGQGDAVVARYKNNQVLIDGGPLSEAGKLLKCLDGQMAFWDRTLEAVVNTHPDEDHFGGLTEILKRYKVKMLLVNGEDNPDSPLFADFEKLISEQKVYSKIASAGVALKVGRLYFDILSPESEGENSQNLLQNKVSGNDNNKNSLVTHLQFGDFDALLTGDLPAEEEQVLVWRKILFPVEVLKLAHHGSKASTSDEILAATKPQLAIISVGKENRFGHPGKEVLEKLNLNGIKFLRTDEAGDVEIVSDGKGWRIK